MYLISGQNKNCAAWCVWQKIIKNIHVQHHRSPDVKTMLTVAGYNLKWKEETKRHMYSWMSTAERYLKGVHACLAFQRADNTASWIIYEVYPTWLTSKLSRFMADLGSLIMSSSFFSRVSIRLSAPSDMTAASVGQSRGELCRGFCPNCVSLHVKPPLCSWLMAVGLAEQPWALSPPKSPPTGIVCTMRRKIFPKQRLPASRNLPSERVPRSTCTLASSE